MKKTMKALLFAVGVLLVFSALVIAVVFGFRLGQNVVSLPLMFSGIVNILTSLFGAVYIFIGGRHDPKSILLKLYLMLSALDTVALFVFEETVGHNLPTLLHAFALIGYCVLAFAPLKRKASERIALCVTMIHVFLFVAEVLLAKAFDLNGLEDIAFLIIDISLDLLIFTKFEDKGE